jgi:integrase
MAKSSRKRHSRKPASGRPEKPYPEFPLYAHPLGYWAKKIKGELCYFGRWGRIVDGKMQVLPDDGAWKEALELYKSQVDDLQAGRKPRAKGEGLTVGELRGRFLTVKSRALDAGEITVRTYAEYRATADRLLSLLGENRSVDNLASDDFEALRADIAKHCGPVRLGNEVQRVRTVFKYAYNAGLIDKPVRFGPGFVKPSKHVLRKHRAKNGKRMFEATEIRALVDAASPEMRAMILLGINAGFGNHDCGTLPLSPLDLEGGWVKFPRPKTGIERRCPLWPETVEALKAAIAKRPTPKEAADADLVFVTKYGHRWVRTQGPKHTPIDSVLQEFGKLLKRPQCPACGRLQIGAEPKKCGGCNWKPSEGQEWSSIHRDGLGFYALRHTFRTVADATKDFPAIRLIMGHADESIDDVYREEIDVSRLQSVAEHVRVWLFGKTPADPEEKKPRICDPRDPSDRADEADGDTNGSLGTQGSQDRKPDTRAMLRIFVG